MSQYYRTLIQGTTVSPYLANLIAYYKFDSSANDFSIEGNNGTIVGTPTFVSGKVNNSINFGTTSLSNYVNIPDDIDFSFTDGINDLSFSISCWVNVTQFSTTLNQILRKRGTSQEEYQFYILPNGQVGFEKYSNLNSSIFQRILSNTSVIATGTWYNIVITNLNSTTAGLKMYVNATQTTNPATNTGAYSRMANGTASTWIGNLNNNFKHRGLVDEFYIWKDRELTSVEVVDIYNKGNAGIPLI